MTHREAAALHTHAAKAWRAIDHEAPIARAMSLWDIALDASERAFAASETMGLAPTREAEDDPDGGPTFWAEWHDQDESRHLLLSVR